jgi:hypothetical protein
VKTPARSGRDERTVSMPEYKEEPMQLATKHVNRVSPFSPKRLHRLRNDTSWSSTNTDYDKTRELDNTIDKTKDAINPDSESHYRTIW